MPVEKTYCAYSAVSIHTKQKLIKDMNRADFQLFPLWASSECIVQFLFARFSVIFFFNFGFALLNWPKEKCE